MTATDNSTVPIWEIPDSRSGMMKRNLIFAYDEVMVPVVVYGSTGTVVQGYAMTKTNYKGQHREEWVSRDSTFILGCNPEGPDKNNERCAAEWRLSVERSLISKSNSCLLLICCDRVQGGLHSPHESSLARILVNDQSLDIIRLKEFHSSQGDYFHRVMHQAIPEIPVVKNCGTVYSFGVPMEHLTRSGKEKIGVLLDPGTGWDIDYVVLILSHTRRKTRPWVIALILAILGAIFGVLATEAWKIF